MLFKCFDFTLFTFLGLEINSTNVRIWIHEKDLESLEAVVYEGHGNMLLSQSAGNVKIRKFLETVPKLMVRNRDDF